MNTPETIPTAYAKDKELSIAYVHGWHHGHGFAFHNVPRLGDKIDRLIDYIGLGDTVTPENIREYHELACLASEENSRSFSPFEFTAHYLNCSDNGDDLWKAFEDGVADSIRNDLATYTDEDYGIEKESNNA